MVEFKKFKVCDLFKQQKGIAKYSKEFIKNNNGIYPVFTGTVGMPIGYINEYVYSGDYLTYTTVGENAGTFEVLNGEFSLGQNRAIAIDIKDGLNIYYLKDLLLIPTSKLLENQQHKSLIWSQLKEVEIEIPVNPDGSFNVEVQEEIANKYKQVETVKQQIEEKLAELSKVKVIVDIEDLDKDIEFKLFKVKDIAEVKRGLTKYSADYCQQNKGIYPLYTAKVGYPFGAIDSYDFDVVNLLTYTARGSNVGTMQILTGKFSLGEHRVAIHMNETFIFLPYLQYLMGLEIKKLIKSAAIPLVHMKTVEDIEIPIPINSNGSFNIEVQEDIANRYKQLEDIQNELSSKLKELKKLKITI